MINFPTTLEEIMLMQPNNVTFGQYALSEVQENILTLIIDALQQHVSNEKELPRDLFNQPYVEIICDEAKKNGKAQIKKAVRDMYKKEFRFRWVHPEIHKTIESEGTIISTMHDIKGTNKIIINFNVWAIPFLLYFGKGVGGTRFNKAIALGLRGDYTKRIYKFICSQRDKTEFHYPLKQFREELQIPDNKSNSEIKRDILEKAKKRIKESSSDVWFDYEMYAKNKPKGRKPKEDTIRFDIKTLHPDKVGGEQGDQYNFVYMWLSWCFNEMKSSKPREFADKLVELGRLKDVYKRCCFYDDQITTGAKTREHAINSLKKMLIDEFKMK